MALAATAPPAVSDTAPTAPRGWPGFQRLATVTAFCTYALIVMGAVVRVSGSGLGCGPDWPTCNGQLLPPPDVSAWIEWTHRAIAAITSPLILATCGAAWLWRRRDGQVLVLATLVPFLLAAQVLLGKLVVELELATMAVLVHLGFALMILGILVWIATAAGPPPRVWSVAAGGDGRRFRFLVAGTTIVMFVLLLAGAYVRATGATWACAGFPECNNQGLFPFGQSRLMDVQLLHRLLAYFTVALVGWVWIEAARSQRHIPALRAATRLLAHAILVQGAIGAAAVSTGVPPLLQGLHVAGAGATWSAMIVVACLAFRTREASPLPQSPSLPLSRPSGHPSAPVPSSAEGAAPILRNRLLTYVQLMKPRVMSLLLLTTLGAMIVAAAGTPPPGLVFWTLLGGALMAGGAGAINHYLDRDIDPIMGRTAWRPIPCGAVEPGHALWFGIVLSALSFALFVAFVNVLSGVLALTGLLVYVFVYTLWLKRTTPSNIVIGGAAGAMPPLVGWAAVTNDIGFDGAGLTAWYLFAIIFFWTPPHFWALALLMRKHYERANIPMLPVVRGESETRWQILLYSLLLVALTLVLFSFRLMGLIYLSSAALLGGVFLYLAVRLWREASMLAARRLFDYSLLYLAALFAAMAVDRVASRAVIP